MQRLKHVTARRLDVGMCAQSVRYAVPTVAFRCSASPDSAAQVEIVSKIEAKLKQN